MSANEEEKKEMKLFEMNFDGFKLKGRQRKKLMLSSSFSSLVDSVQLKCLIRREYKIDEEKEEKLMMMMKFGVN